MSGFVETQINTSSGLRDKLFETLDKLIEGKINLDYVEGVVAVSEQIITSARLDFEVAVKHQEYKERRENILVDLGKAIDTLPQEISTRNEEIL